MAVRTVEQILATIEADTIAENPSLCDWSLHSMLRKTTIPFAKVVQGLEVKIENAAEAQNVLTATGADLDDLAKDRGLTRLTGTKATGQINFIRTTAASADIPIPAGTEVSAQDTDGEGPVYFVTIAAVTLLAGQTSISAYVEASEAGARGNVRAAAIVAVSGGLSGVDYVTNPLTFTGGADEESDDDLRQRYIATATEYGRATVPTMKEWLEAVESSGSKIVREAKVYNKGRGDAEIIVDTTPTETNIGLVGDAIEECISAGVCGRGMLAAHLEADANTGDLGDAAGGQIWLRARVSVTALDEFTFDYVTPEGATHEATASVPAGTVEGQYVEVALAEGDTDVASVPVDTYAGAFEYDVLIGYGAPPLLFLLPEKVTIDVVMTYVATATPESDLDDLIQASIEAFLDDFMIGEELQFSDLYDAARIQYLGDGEWGDRFYGIDEITALSATDGATTIAALGDKITVESDSRLDPGDVLINPPPT